MVIHVKWVYVTHGIYCWIEKNVFISHMFMCRNNCDHYLTNNINFKI